ncbi:MAG: LCP family protein [Clostridia bacterium]|nr:LCP family protein [Clostridia bacterium]
MEKTNQPNRILKRVFFGLLAAFVVLGIVAGILFRTYMSKFYQNRVEVVAAPTVSGEPLPTEVPPTPDPFAAALSTDVDYYETGEIQNVPIYSQDKIDRYIISILVVVKNGSIASEEQQTDMIFIISYNQLLMKFSAVGIPRDTLVQIDGYGWKRINAAYSLGGIGLLTNTINQSFGLDIQNYVYIGTEELARLADNVNGIPVNLTDAEAAYLNEQLGTSLSAGQQQLTGEQIVAYLLDRTSDNKGDLGRTEKQLTVIHDTFDYLTDTFDKTFLYPFMAMVGDSVRTNLEYDILAGIAYVMAVSDDLTFHTLRIPFDDAYTEMSYDGGYAILPEFEKNRILVMQELYGKE